MGDSWAMAEYLVLTSQAGRSGSLWGRPPSLVRLPAGSGPPACLVSICSVGVLGLEPRPSV